MSDKIQDKKGQDAEKTKASDLKDDELKNVVGGGAGAPTKIVIGPAIPKK
ncbi:hypothetical protein [Telmatospirillum sp.]|nr:hypothetical protein [Telmatospirillum sp.]MDR3437888.1 hypothetical protein [Telmatospirillum sp.]